MPAKEIKELRLAGKLEEAYAMAKAELESDSSNIWGKRNLSWVLYAQLDAVASNLDAFLAKINEVKELDLPASEEMFFDNISIVISKAARLITHEATLDINKVHRLFDSIKELSLKRNSKWFSVLFNAIHKGMKESNRYIEFADWWDFKNFRPEDYQKEKMPNGKEVMAIAEQAYIAYAKHLMPKQVNFGMQDFHREKVLKFLPNLDLIIEKYPDFVYTGYYKAKLLLTLGDKENILAELLPFARKKKNDFWVWDILSEACQNDKEKVFACYCKALSCQSPEEMLVNLRQKMARILVSKTLYSEAKTEIDQLVKIRKNKEYNIPSEVASWQTTEWYKNAVASKSNLQFYKKYIPIAEELIFSDIPEELVIVEFVNSDKKILNFIASENKFGFFKYERFFENVKIGDILKVKFEPRPIENRYNLYSASLTTDDVFKSHFFKKVAGNVKIQSGKQFGFLNDIFVHSSIISKLKLTDGMAIEGDAIKTYNQEKKQWGWKLIS